MDPTWAAYLARYGAPQVQGMPGTPGGPAQESPAMHGERVGQGLTGAFLAALGGGIGDAVAGPFGWGAAAPGVAMTGDAMFNKNIRDTSADRNRMERQMGEQKYQAWLAHGKAMGYLK